MQTETIVKVATDLWYRQLSRANTLFDELTDEQLSTPIAPGRNSGIYLLGHLTAVHDAMLPLLGLGEKFHPDLFDIFVKHPDTATIQKPPVADLKNYWQQVNKALNEKISHLTFSQWMEKHTAIAAEDFEKEPHRNRLSVLLSRTAHLTEHIGQLLWARK
jgi:hypothetical protein